MDGTPTVVTIARGREEHLRNLALGLARGTSWPAALVVVVMGGDDPTHALPCDLPFAVVRRWCEPDGDDLPLARARNTGTAAVATEHVVLLDVDVIAGRDLVAAYARLLAARDVVAMGPVRYLRPGAAAAPWTERELVDRSHPHPGRPVPDIAGPTDDHARFWSLSFAARTTTLRRLGGFDEGYTGYGAEDTDLAFTIRRAGVPLWWEPRAVGFHQHHPVHDPPLPHVRSIVANARRFHDRWGRWPMEGWLRAFDELGVVRFAPEADQLAWVRDATADELVASRRTDGP